MELTPRKQAVLKAIIKAYIETGEPIGSKNLTALLENAPSSATLRNEMSELCELGLLDQPHTSAGRVPTVGGYRIYVDRLMAKAPLSDATRELIDSGLEELSCEPEGIPAAAAQLVSKLTGLPAIACLMTAHPSKIKRVELLPIGRNAVLLLAITEDGRTRSRVFRQSKALSPEAEECFYKLISTKIKGKCISELTKAYMQSVAAYAGVFALELMPWLTAVFDTVSEIEETDVTLKGKKALYNICAAEDEAMRILSLVNRRDPIISILEGIGDSVGAVFGADTGYNELKGETVIAAKFSAADKYKGYLGVIGPNRMSYEQIMPTVQYISRRMTEIMTEAQKDMED